MSTVKEKQEPELVVIRDKDGFVRGFSSTNYEIVLSDEQIFYKTLTDEEIIKLNEAEKILQKEKQENATITKINDVLKSLEKK